MPRLTRVRLLMILALLPMAACADQRQGRFDAGAAACRAAIPEQIGNYVRRVECINQAAAQAGFKGPAEELVAATRVALAEKVDRGEITPAEARERFATLKYKLEQDAAAQRATQAQVAAMILGSMPAPQPYVVPVPSPIVVPTMQPAAVNQPWNATCMRIGQMLSCHGN